MRNARLVLLAAATLVTLAACHDATAPAPAASFARATTKPAFDTGDTLTTTCLSGHTVTNGVCGP